MSIFVSAGLVESVVRYCCLCMVVFYNLVMFAMHENAHTPEDFLIAKITVSATTFNRCMYENIKLTAATIT
jgi:hypothetical protein